MGQWGGVEGFLVGRCFAIVFLLHVACNLDVNRSRTHKLLGECMEFQVDPKMGRFHHREYKDCEKTNVLNDKSGRFAVFRAAGLERYFLGTFNST